MDFQVCCILETKGYVIIRATNGQCTILSDARNKSQVKLFYFYYSFCSLKLYDNGFLQTDFDTDVWKYFLFIEPQGHGTNS